MPETMNRFDWMKTSHGVHVYDNLAWLELLVATPLLIGSAICFLRFSRSPHVATCAWPAHKLFHAALAAFVISRMAKQALWLSLNYAGWPYAPAILDRTSWCLYFLMWNNLLAYWWRVINGVSVARPAFWLNCGHSSLVVVLVVLSKGTWDDQDLQNWLNLSHFVFWGILALLTGVTGLSMQRRICVATGHENVPCWTQAKAASIFVCSLLSLFCSTAIGMLQHFNVLNGALSPVSSAQSKNETLSEWEGNVLSTAVLEYWVPTYLPAYLFLLVMWEGVLLLRPHTASINQVITDDWGSAQSTPRGHTAEDDAFTAPPQTNVYDYQPLADSHQRGPDDGET